jgi:hypothetical protein
MAVRKQCAVCRGELRETHTVWPWDNLLFPPLRIINIPLPSYLTQSQTLPGFFNSIIARHGPVTGIDSSG